MPAYRRSKVNSLLCLVGIFFAPAVLWVCIVVLTGPVYEPYHRLDGTLKTWSFVNKIAAVLILFLEVVVWVQFIRTL